ncbi:MAG: hypothetical protein HYY46_15475 [Deltaproteobacteria bacterium]|nr:hypothetical protein [Deltaproteobacteria bacterium]
MSYTPEDAAQDRFFDELEKELYPQHKEQAIEEFTNERFQSVYTKNPEIAKNAALFYREAKSLLDHGHPSASFVFAVSAIEQLLKATLLKPVVYGLVHHDPLAELIVEFTFGQTGFDRYNKLLAKLFESLAGINLDTVQRQGSAKKLLDEVSDLQKLRNRIIHQGLQTQDAEAKNALSITEAVFSQIVIEMLRALGLRFEKSGKIVPAARV